PQPPPAAPLPTQKNPPADMPPPEVSGTPTKTPPALTVPEPKPPRPRTRPRNTTTTPPTEPDPAATQPTSPKPDAPRISPRYSPAEEAAFRQQTSQAIHKAEQNLQKMSGRQLNAAQNDMVEKIRGFLGQAREAIQANDWFRAQNLASKAEVLSEELVRSP
ncbi:MAG: hypothetical protein HY046_02590, partial [Acidobacteria bacterium]|nr:hypothetical protein [Acidobacteriota bacterium]